MKPLTVLLIATCILALAAGLGGCAALPSDENASQSQSPISQSEGLSSDQSVTSLTFQAQYVRTNSYQERKTYPLVVPIRTREQLDSYLDKNNGAYSFSDSFDDTPSFLKAIEDYGDCFFSQKSLLLVVLEESSGSIRHEVASVVPQKQGVQVNVRRICPDAYSQDMAQWHIIIELDDNALDDGQLYSAIIT